MEYGIFFSQRLQQGSTDSKGSKGSKGSKNSSAEERQKPALNLLILETSAHEKS